jgi:hypothetical protein
VSLLHPGIFEPGTTKDGQRGHVHCSRNALLSVVTSVSV